MTEKTCANCKTTKPITEFSKNTGRYDGVNVYCSQCTTILAKKLRQANKYIVFSIYSGNKNPECACCAETELEFLSIDHINGGGGVHLRSKEVKYNLVRWLIKNKYPNGFRVLCLNCNFAIGHYGYCPHTSNKNALKETQNYLATRKGRGGVRRQILTDEQIAEIKNTSREISSTKLAEKYKVSWDTINRIRKKRKTKKGLHA